MPYYETHIFRLWLLNGNKSYVLERRTRRSWKDGYVEKCQSQAIFKKRTNIGARQKKQEVFETGSFSGKETHILCTCTSCALPVHVQAHLVRIAIKWHDTHTLSTRSRKKKDFEAWKAQRARWNTRKWARDRNGQSSDIVQAWPRSRMLRATRPATLPRRGRRGRGRRRRRRRRRRWRRCYPSALSKLDCNGYSITEKKKRLNSYL